MSHDLLVQMLQSDLLANILEYADDIEKCSENITIQVREMIGARVVALLITDADGDYRLLAACPARRGEIFNNQEIRRLVAHAGGLKKATLIVPGQGESGLILSGLGINESFVVPLRVGDESFGMLFLLDLMDTQGIQRILDALRDISGLLSLVFKQSFLYHNMESLVAERTEALWESELRSLDILQTAMDGFLCIDVLGCIIDVNNSYCRMSGYSRNELLKMTVAQLAVKLSQEEIAERIKSILSGRSVRFETIHQRKDGSLMNLEISSQLRSGSDGNEIFSFLRDITELKLAEREKEILQAQLMQAQKMEAIGTLAGGIAHDFNNILGAILGYAEMAREDCPLDSVIAGDLDQVVKAGHRAKDLVKQILAFSRQTETEKGPLQPAIMVKEAVKLLRSLLPTTIDIRQDIDADAGLIFADPTQIHQILMNLGTNAFHAMEEAGGILLISLKGKVLSAQDLVANPSLQPGRFVELSVSDNGSGIPQDLQQRIFDPYFTTKETGKGSGMGLAIVHGIIKSCGGFITCRSQPGEGSVFAVNLPVFAGNAVPESRPVQSVPVGTERILFIDDEKILVDLARSMLERMGYAVTGRTSGLEALTTFRNQPDAFDLVITDQTMPGMTGIDLARSMLQIRPDLPIILCTGYSSQVSEEKARSFGIKGFAMKPLAKKDIAGLIRKILGEGQSIV